MMERPPLKVAIDVLSLAGPRTGVGVSCEELLRSLVGRSDIEVTAFAIARRAGRLGALLPEGTRFRHLGLPTRIAHRAWMSFGTPSAELVVGRVSVVHGTNFVVPPPRRAAAVITVNDVTPWRYPELCAPASLGYPVLVRRAVVRGAFVHTASHYVADELREIVAVPAARVRVIPYGLPPRSGHIGQATAPALSALDGPFVLAVSTIEPRKDYPTLVRAFAEMAGSHPGLRLVLAGAEGRGSPALDAAIARSRLGGRVVRLGYVDDSVRASLLARASALAYPSLYEGFGFPPLEAMAAGVPVVACAGGAVPEIVGDGALVVPVGDVAALAGALEAVLSDEGLRVGLRSRGLAQAARYSWTSTAEAMVGLYFDAADSLR